MSTQHTPTPWRTAKINTATWAIRAGEYSLAAVYTNLGSPTLNDQDGEGQANAAHIVRCVNSHDALVEALRQCKLDIEVARSGADLSTRGWYMACAALKAATEQP